MSKKAQGKFKVLFVAGFGAIVQDIPKSHKFYVDALGLSFQKEAGDYLHTEKLDGVKTFALWPLSQAAQSCFGSESWPSDLPVPQAWLEFDVDDIEQAGTELKRRGYTLLTKEQKEPWGRLLLVCSVPRAYWSRSRLRRDCASSHDDMLPNIRLEQTA